MVTDVDVKVGWSKLGATYRYVQVDEKKGTFVNRRRSFLVPHPYRLTCGPVFIEIARRKFPAAFSSHTLQLSYNIHQKVD
jgi:hypothetical protein